MITGNIKDCKRYSGMNEAFAKAFAFLQTLTEESMDEKIDEGGVRGDISVIKKSDTTADGSPKPFEAHRKYIDIHFVVKGEERFGYAHIDTLIPATEYDETDDYPLLTGKPDFLTLRPGDFCITYPEDAHMPCMTTDGEAEVKKVILKIADQ